MKKSLLLISTFLLILNIFSQQQIGNSDFEAWEVTSPELHEPVNWNSFKTATGTWNSFSGQQIDWSSDVRTGSTGIYSARIWSRDAGFGVVANGNMTLGRIEMGSTTASSSSNYNYSNTGDVNFSEAFTGTPDSIVFWVKYTPVVAGSNEARASIVIHNNTNNYKDPNDVAGVNTIATAILNFPTTNGLWVRKSVPFSYVGTPGSAAFILATFTTNKIPGGGSVNDQLLIDDVTLIYNPVNEAVVANDDVATTFEDVPVDITVLANDTDPENDFDISSLNITSNPTNGMVNVNTINGVITYTPNAGYFGNDSFEYEICDNGSPVLCDVATVNITINEVITGNNPIIANDDVATTDMNVSVTTNVLANDQDYENQIDNSTLAVTVQPANGTTTVNTVSGEITYTPDLGYFGFDSYTYSICDAGTPSITCDEAIVNVTVNLTWGIQETIISENIAVSLSEDKLFFLSENELIGSYRIYSSCGLIVQIGQLEPSVLFKLSGGVYFIQIDSNNGQFIRKIVNH